MTIALLVPVATAALSTKRDHRAWWIATSTLILATPGVVGMNIWYGLPAVPLMAVLIALGTDRLIPCSMSPRALAAAIYTACGLVIVGWTLSGPATEYSLFQVAPGNHLLFGRARVTRGEAIAAFLEHLPPDNGVMAPIGLVPELAYQSSQRLIAIPATPELLYKQISQYKISYVVVARELSYNLSRKLGRQVMKPTIQHILTNPQHFKNVALFSEPKSIDSSGDEYAVFAVNRIFVNEHSGPGHE